MLVQICCPLLMRYGVGAQWLPPVDEAARTTDVGASLLPPVDEASADLSLGYHMALFAFSYV